MTGSEHIGARAKDPDRDTTTGRLNALSIHPLFAGCDDDDVADLAGESRRHVKRDGDVVVEEGDPAETVFILTDGAVSVERAGADAQPHTLVTLTAPAHFGEAALLPDQRRGATVRAQGRASLMEIGRDQLVEMARTRPGFSMVLLRLLEGTMQHLRRSSDLSVEQLDRALQESQMRVRMGRFLVLTIIGFTAYTAFISLVNSAEALAVKSEFITIPVLIATMVFVLAFMRTSGFSARFFGLTLESAGKAAFEGVVASIPLMVVAVGVKALLVRGTDTPLFEMFPGGGQIGTIAPGLVLAYALFVPVQELICRGALQGTLEVFLTGKYRALEANVAANAVFLAAHLYISYRLSLIAFVCGLYWGWLYRRQRTLVGVAVCHILVGLFAFEVVGLPGIE